MALNNIVMFTRLQIKFVFDLFGAGSLIDLIVCRSSNPSAGDPGTAPRP